MNNIIFTNTGNIPKEFLPKPASRVIPEWYKDLESYFENIKKPNGSGGTTATIKRCMPVFDSISAGYILFSPADVFVTQRDGQPYYEWANYGLIAFHPQEQAPTYPSRNEIEAFPKWVNHWSIKTPKGYSVLIVQPFHRESVFTILPAIVDTDKYTAPINFPFVLNDRNFEGIIPAGTPIAQIIPFKRESWEMIEGGKEEFIEQAEVQVKVASRFFDKYKNLFRSSKEFK